VVVYHDGPVAAWSNASALRDAGISSRDFAEQCELGGTEAKDENTGAVSQRYTESTSSSMQDADAASDEDMLSVEPRAESKRASMQDADAATDEEVPPSQQRAQPTRAPLPEDDFNTDDEGGEYPAPWNILTSLRISSDAERQPEAEDPYYAARLAATCVILLRDEKEEAAKVLGQWSIDLVGRRLWYRMVEAYITTPRGENENGA